MRWYLIEFSIIILGFNQVIIMSTLILISLWLWNFSIDVLIQIILFKDQGDYVLPCSKVIIPSKLVLKLSMVSHLFKWEPQMEIENIYILLIWGVQPSSGASWTRVYYRNPNFPSLEFGNSVWIEKCASLRRIAHIGHFLKSEVGILQNLMP